MPSDQVVLRYAHQGRWAAVRELRGTDESAVSGTTTAAAIDLIDRVLTSAPGTGIRPGEAGSLTATDRDRILATIFQRAYGGSVTGSGSCPSCEEAFDIEFKLSDVMDHIDDHIRKVTFQPDGNGGFTLPNGVQFRLPTGEDECAVLGYSHDEAVSELMSRCILRGAGDVDMETCEAAMDEVAPLVDLDMAASCPSCGTSQTLHFDLQRYLLKRLIADQRRLAVEVHNLATTYGWGVGEILELPRSQRRTFVDLADRTSDDLYWRPQA